MVEYYTYIKSEKYEDFITASKTLVTAMWKKTEQMLSCDSNNDIKHLQGLEENNKTWRTDFVIVDNSDMLIVQQ